MSLTKQITKRIIKKLLNGDDYRVEIVSLINANFLQHAIDFFKKIVDAKLKNIELTQDWYKRHFILDPDMAKRDIAINSGLNMKTIGNMYNSTKREVVLEASQNHYDSLSRNIGELVDRDDNIDLSLTIRLKSVSVDLNVSESLIVINALAVKRSALRGGFWSATGKRVEKPLMLSLCKLYRVSNDFYRLEDNDKTEIPPFEREVDFYLVSNNKMNKCEVKLMGKGNPESADSVFARDISVFIADKLSPTNNAQLDASKVQWVELRSEVGFRKFREILKNLRIPHRDFDEQNFDETVEAVLSEVF